MLQDAALCQSYSKETLDEIPDSCCTLRCSACSSSASGSRTAELCAFRSRFRRVPGFPHPRSGHDGEGRALLAFCAARKELGDWADIDIALRRSADGGRT